tara:strand:+ start:424 stop:1317 length:894 start_codon:yes stop_codon:yes gene_type:complete
MTVINIGKNKNTICLVADKMGSYSNRERLTASKLYLDTLDDAIFGITGTIGPIEKSIENLELYTKGDDLTSQLDLLSKSMKDTRKSSIENILDSQYSVSFHDVVSGNKEKIDEPILHKLQQEISNPDGSFEPYNKNLILAGGFKGKIPKLYRVNHEGVIPVKFNYDSVGSGMDMSLSHLDEFYESINDPDNLSTREMMENLVKAKIKSSNQNRGVGGNSDIAIYKKGEKPRKIAGNESRFFEEIVELKSQSLVKPRIANKSLDQLIAGEKFESLYPEIFDIELKDDKKNLYLRGYKV